MVCQPLAARPRRAHAEREGRLVRPDGRTVAWTECGAPDGRPCCACRARRASRYSVRTDQAPWARARPAGGHRRAAGLRGLHAPPGPGLRSSTPTTSPRSSTASGCRPRPRVRRQRRRAARPGLRRATPRPRLGLLRRRRRRAAHRRGGGAADRRERGRRPAGAGGPGRRAARPARAAPDVHPGRPGRRLPRQRWTPPRPRTRRSWPTRPGRRPWRAASARRSPRASTAGSDEVLALDGDWARRRPRRGLVPRVTWWHGDGDRNCPLSAARRLVAPPARTPG